MVVAYDLAAYHAIHELWIQSQKNEQADIPIANILFDKKARKYRHS